VLLHGLFASGRYFGAAYDALAAEFQVVVPDLPGFGRSTAAAGPPSLDTYGDAVARCLADLGVREPAAVVGHSFGCLVAIDAAYRHPDLVSALVLFGPPVYREAAAYEHLASLGLMERHVVTGSPAFRLVLAALGRLHPSVGTLARPDLPGAIVADALRSDWQAQSEAIACLLRNDCASALRTLAMPVTAVYGESDRIPDRELLAETSGECPAMSIVVVPAADHHVLLTRTDTCLDIIRSSYARGQRVAA
jgi:3-oxoadipate enol-lactonase